MSKKVKRSSRSDLNDFMQITKSMKLNSELFYQQPELTTFLTLSFKPSITETHSLTYHPEIQYYEEENLSIHICKDCYDDEDIQLIKQIQSNTCQEVCDNLPDLSEFEEELVNVIYHNDPKGEKINLEITKTGEYFEEACHGEPYYQYFMTMALPNIMKRDILEKFGSGVRSAIEKDIYHTAIRLGEIIYSRDFFHEWYNNLVQQVQI